MEINEIIALCAAFGLAALTAIYEAIMHRRMRSRLREMRDSVSAWKALYRSIKEERDLLAHRVQSKDCQKVICYQTQLEAAEEEIERLTKLNETYKRQIESGKKKKTASGSAIAEGC